MDYAPNIDIITGQKDHIPVEQNKQCAAGVYTIRNFEHGSEKIQIFTKNLVHNHDDCSNKSYKMIPKIRKMITEMIDKKMKKKGILLYSLTRTPDIVVPTSVQVQKQTNKIYIRLKTFVSVDTHMPIPENVDTAFVVTNVINMVMNHGFDSS